MTMIATALGDDAVVQVSDRKITSLTLPNLPPENKAVCLSCADANVAFAFILPPRRGVTVAPCARAVTTGDAVAERTSGLG
jgi:hypothetical protein